MAIIIGKEQLCSTNLKYFKGIQGIEGRTLFDRYSFGVNIIQKNIDTQFQDFLAYPVQEDNMITFFGKQCKDTPQILSGLNGEDSLKYQNIKDETLVHYKNKIESLRVSNKSVDAEFLDSAIKYVNDDFVYCYDNIVVLGIWGMQLQDNIREDINVIRKNLANKKVKPSDPLEPAVGPKVTKVPIIEPTVPDPKIFKVLFLAGDGGSLVGNSEFEKYENDRINENEVPTIEPKEGYVFEGWDKNPNNFEIIDDTEFVAQYRKKSSLPLPITPWYLRFWNWLLGLFAGRNWLKWLLWLLLFLLLLWLLRNCHGCSGNELAGGAALGDNDSTWVHEDPRTGYGGGIYDPHDPYTPIPTEPGYEGVLPPQQGVMPPISDNPEIIPGNPSILANRLNILMENEDKSIMDLAKAFKEKYPDEKYKIVYYDNVIKRMQIEVPKEEREQLKQAIPDQFAPEYELFVFDEALFEGAYTPNDPSFADPNKSWYLKAINAPKAWDISMGSEKVTVAIVDNGFNLKHPELSTKVVQPYNVWTHSSEIFQQKVDHGTHVAGTALATINNNIGISGLASNCRFMPIQVANKQGLMTTTSVLDGILYALYQGADVVNVSLSSQFTSVSQLPESTQQDLIRNHFKEEERLWREIMRIAANHNATIVLAAGNENVLTGIDAIQRPELFITVSAVDKKQQPFSKASFSNYGQFSTISAPGVDIYSTVGENDYKSMNGTSMAAPIVTGAVALMKSVNPSITTKQIICILKETGIPVQGNIGKLLQLDKALAIVKSGTKLDCTPKPSTGDVQVLLNWNNYNDLDLICTDPNGEPVFFRNRSVSSGGQLEIDMNVEYPDTKTPLENIFWSPGTAPNGTYNVYLLYYKNHESAINETPYQIKVKYGSKTEDYKGSVKKDDKVVHICSFTIGTNAPSNTNGDLDSNQSNSEIIERSKLEQERNRLQTELDRVNKELNKIGNRH